MMVQARGRILRSSLLVALVVMIKPISNLFLLIGVRQFHTSLAANPLPYVRALFEPLVALGIVMQIFWLLARMALLSVADLSYVLPVTAFGYVLSTILGRVFLHEAVTAEGWAGNVLIVAGAVFVGSTAKDATLKPPAGKSPAGG